MGMVHYVLKRTRIEYIVFFFNNKTENIVYDDKMKRVHGAK